MGAGASILGNVKIGTGAKIGAAAVVLTDIPAHCTAVGCPAKVSHLSWIQVHHGILKEGLLTMLSCI